MLDRGTGCYESVMFTYDDYNKNEKKYSNGRTEKVYNSNTSNLSDNYGNKKEINKLLENNNLKESSKVVRNDDGKSMTTYGYRKEKTGINIKENKEKKSFTATLHSLKDKNKFKEILKNNNYEIVKENGMYIDFKKNNSVNKTDSYISFKVPASFAKNFPNLSSSELKDKYKEFLNKYKK